MPSTLRVNLSAVGRGCQQDPTPPGVFPRPGNYAFLLDCNGTPVVKAGKEFGPVPFDHGYAEFHDVDPGTYLVLVMVNPFHVAGEAFQSNQVSLHEVVICECCDTVCVTVYQTGWHQCFRVNVLVLRTLAQAGVLPGEVVERATAALEEALKVGAPQPADAAILQVVGRVAAQFERTTG